MKNHHRIFLFIHFFSAAEFSYRHLNLSEELTFLDHLINLLSWFDYSHYDQQFKICIGNFFYLFVDVHITVVLLAVVKQKHYSAARQELDDLFL